MTIRTFSIIRAGRHAISTAALAGAGALVLTGLAAGCASSDTGALAPSQGVPSASSQPAASAPSRPTGSASSRPAASASSRPAVIASSQPAAQAGTVESSGSRTPAGGAVLSPATVPPVSAECGRALTRYQDGTVAPVLCANGGVNTRAWRYYAGDFPGSQVLALGRGATATQVYQAMCQDVIGLHATFPMSQCMEELAQAYYGWNVDGKALAAREVQRGCQ